MVVCVCTMIRINCICGIWDLRLSIYCLFFYLDSICHYRSHIPPHTHNVSLAYKINFGHRVSTILTLVYVMKHASWLSNAYTCAVWQCVSVWVCVRVCIFVLRALEMLYSICLVRFTSTPWLFPMNKTFSVYIFFGFGINYLFMFRKCKFLTKPSTNEKIQPHKTYHTYSILKLGWNRKYFTNCLLTY